LSSSSEHDAIRVMQKSALIKNLLVFIALKFKDLIFIVLKFEFVFIFI
jgi:hypothetical protein